MSVQSRSFLPVTQRHGAIVLGSQRHQRLNWRGTARRPELWTICHTDLFLYNVR